MDPKNNAAQTQSSDQQLPVSNTPTNIPANPPPPITPVQSPTQTPAPQPITPPETPKKSSKKLIFISLFLILVILALISIPIALSYNSYKVLAPPQTIQNLIDGFITITPLPKTPRIILAKTENSIANIKSANIENIIEFKTEDKTSPIKSASITISGPIDFKTQNSSKIALDIAGNVSMEGIQLSGSGSIRKIENNIYLKINEFPAASLLPIAQLKNQWFYVNIDQLQGKKTNDTGKIVQDLQKVFQKFAQKSANWSQKTEDKANYNLKIRPPSEEKYNFLFDIIETLEADTSTNLEKNIQKDNLKRIADGLEDFEINIIVDKKTYMVSEINLQTTLTVQSPPASKQTGTINLAPTNALPLKLKIASKFTKYNEPVLVEIPKDAKDLKEIVGQLQKSLPKNEQFPNNPFTNPAESTPQAKPKDQTGFRNLLDNTSPVLGTQNTNWDKILLQYVNGII